MGSNPNSVFLKVFVDEKKKKVMFAEAPEDFVEILFSFFTLPLGTIAGLASKHPDSKDIKVGSLTSLYESMVNLDANHFANQHCKHALVNPNNSSASICQKLKVNLNDTKTISAGGDAVFFKNKASFIITDDLNVVPVMLDSTIVLLNSLGVEYIDLLDERIISFGLEEFSNLLKFSLITNNPLTSLVLGGRKPCSCSWICSSCQKNFTLSDSDLSSSSSGKTHMVKLLVQKSKNKVLCAQVGNFFVELLFSFLTIPLGTAHRLAKDGLSTMGISNLYNSISSLQEGKYLKTEDVKTLLLSPELATNYLRVTDFLPIYDVNTRPGSFLKEEATFVVSDNLEVTVSPSISVISNFNNLGVPVSDIDVMEVSVGEQEALSILRAFLTSTSALTDWLNESRKKPKTKRSKLNL